jgi:hypothetical protein
VEFTIFPFVCEPKFQWSLFIYFVLDLIYLDLFSEIYYCFVVVFIVGICYTTSLVMVLEQWLWCVLGCL